MNVYWIKSKFFSKIKVTIIKMFGTWLSLLLCIYVLTIRRMFNLNYNKLMIKSQIMYHNSFLLPFCHWSASVVIVWCLSGVHWQGAATKAGILPRGSHPSGHPATLQVIKVWQSRPCPHIIWCVPRQGNYWDPPLILCSAVFK